jgi:WhiB family redox-sensing transcriptional regulator
VVANQQVADWQVRAACRGPQAVIFYPPSHIERRDERREREREAKEICHSCQVRKECLDYALRIKEPHGIWGGLNEAERRRIIARGIPHFALA